MESKLSLMVIIVNSGYSDEVISFIKDAGAQGGTILNGIGSVKKDAEKLYGITVNPEKEVLLVIADKKIKNKLLKTFYEKAGRDTVFNGVAFSVPIESATSNLLNQYVKQPEEVI